MTVECEHCYKDIENEQRLIEYDQLPYHTDCIKKMFREDNPNLEEQKYEEFDKMAEKVDKFQKSGNLLIPILFERSE